MEEKRLSKSEIRRSVLKLRDQLTTAERERSEILLTERILGHQWYYGAEELLVFISFGSEIDTAPIWTEALRQKKKVYAPCVCGEKMEFYRIFGKEDLRAGYKGIPEPSEPEKRERFVFAESRAARVLMLMPGAAFDAYRSRIGYGKGYYDRYLADKASLHTIAVGYRCQMVERIWADDTDIKPMQVICL